MSQANLTFKRPDGSDCPAYQASLPGGRRGVVVLQEWWGLNEQICSVADRLAAAGYQALAPDLYHGRVAQDADEASHLMDGLDFAGATFEDIRGAIAHLPEVNAAVCFYGIPPKEVADPAQIRIPFQAHFASRDHWCTPAAVDALEAAMRDAGQSPEIHRYEGEHAFFNKLRPEVYDPEASELAWKRTLDFLLKHM